jgi:hypothetical protein
VTGSIYIATGRLTNFLDDATLDPGIIVAGPPAPGEPGPFNLLITPALVGAGVTSPHGSIPGMPKMVLAAEVIDGTVLTGSSPEILNAGLPWASVSIVSPAIQVVQNPAYLPGQTNFPVGADVQYSGYVTNTGDITLTNVMVVADRIGEVQLLKTIKSQLVPADGILVPGESASFAYSFRPTTEETSAGSAPSQLTVTAQDTTTIGGPNASVTNSTSTASAIGGTAPWVATLSKCNCSTNHQFQFDVAGLPDVQYLIQATTNLNSTNWVSIATNSGSFTFVDTDTARYPARFYRAVALP